MNLPRPLSGLAYPPLTTAGQPSPTAHASLAIMPTPVSPIMPAMPSALHEHLSVLRNWQLFDEEWLFQPVPWRQRWLAILVVGLFVVACVPLCAILVVSMALQPIMPASPTWRHVQATILACLCLAAEVVWFGSLIWWISALIL